MTLLAPMHVRVVRRFPTYDLVVTTPLDCSEVRRRISAAVAEPTRRGFWPSPLAQLSGEVSGGLFNCYARSSAFGGSAAPRVSGEVVPNDEGGSTLSVRISDWSLFLLFGGLVALFVSVEAAAPLSLTSLKHLAVLTWVLLASVGFYTVDVRFVRRILMRVLSQEPPAV